VDVLMKTRATGKNSNRGAGSPHRFEPAKIDALFVVLDAIAWMDSPSSGQIAQYADVDPRTAGKLLKNARQIGLVEQLADGYTLVLPYPFRGSLEQKQAVVREALFRLQLLTSVRQFMGLGDTVSVALRKAATIAGITPYVESDLVPLVEWARALKALEPRMLTEDLLDTAAATKEARHKRDATRRVAFLSHSSKDKPFIRQLAGDLVANGVAVWLDEQRIRVGDSIPERIAQGLAESDYFLIGVSQQSVESEWVKKELNNALIKEIERRKVHVLPLKLDDSPMPDIIRDKKYADFSKSYKSGLSELLVALRESVND
jgi:hypothetical protein